MRFVVATQPDVKFSLGRDVALAKVTALYGEDTVLYSPTYSGTEPFLDLAARPLIHQLLWLAKLTRDPGFIVGEKLTKAEREKRIRDAAARSDGILALARRWIETDTDPHAADRDEVRRLTESKLAPLVERVTRAWSEDDDIVKRARQLRRAADLGLIRIEPFEKKPRSSIFYDPRDLDDAIERALSAGDAYAALDERFVSTFKRYAPAQLGKQRSVAVAAEVFRRLPNFSAATFDEIRDIRSELHPYVTNFRKGLLQVSEEIRSAPWDKDFPHDVERALTTRLLPEVQAIENEVRSNSYLAELIHKGVSNPLVLPSSSALGMLLSTSAHASALVSQVASTIAGASVLALQARREWKQKHALIKGNAFFFCYEARRLLKRR